MATYVNPLDDIRQWDGMACETACTAQLLYMYGKLKFPFDEKAFDARIGRSPGQADLCSGNLRVLFEEGFRVSEVSPADLHRIVTDVSYVRDKWISLGMEAGEVDAALLRIYPKLRERILHRIAVIDRYADKYERSTRESNWLDVVAMMEDGYHVGCHIQRGTGTTHQLLIVGSLGADTYQVFVPDDGVRAMRENELASSLLSGIEGFRLA